MYSVFFSVDVGPGIDPKLLKPVLNDAEGYYQIGPSESCNEYFVLSVTVSFAENLPQVKSFLSTSVSMHDRTDTSRNLSATCLFNDVFKLYVKSYCNKRVISVYQTQ